MLLLGNRAPGGGAAEGAQGPVLRFGAAIPISIEGLILSTRPVLALDLGGTQVRAAVVLPDGARVARVAARTPSSEGPAAVVRACVEALETARDEAAATLPDPPVAVGISCPGPVNPWTGTVGDTPNLGPSFRDVPLATSIEDALGLPAFLDRDTNVAALGEQAFGAAQGLRHFLYMTVSTGIGGAVVTEHGLLHGPDGTAGELGHVVVDLDGPICGCGTRGHLEAIASGVALARDARAAAAGGVSPFLAARAAERPGGMEGPSARDVAEGEAAGDPTCHRLMDRARRAIAAACVTFTDLFNPEAIVIGGAIANAQGPTLLDPIRQAIAEEAFRAPAERVRILPAGLGPDVSIAGAQPLVASRLGNPAWRAGRPSTPTSVVA